MTIYLLVGMIVIIAIYLGFLVFQNKDLLLPMHGMMIAMAMAMMVSLTIGILLAIMGMDNPTLTTIYMIVLGVITGYLYGTPFGALAQLDGILAGVMGGLMGPMTGWMVKSHQPHLFLGFFVLLYIIIVIMLYRLINQESTQKRNYLFATLCMITVGLSIFQSTSNTFSYADSKHTHVQKDGLQQATIYVDVNSYSPSSLSLKSGMPVKLNFHRAENVGCLSYLVIPSLKVNKKLQQGDNYITFTPKQPQTIHFSCSMGMYRGTLTVK
jgi:hypothetical protein